MTAARIISRFIFPSRAFGAVVRAAWLPAVALALLSAAAVPGSCAQSITMTGRAGAIVVADSRISIEQAVRMAEQKFKARVVRAESQDEGGKTVYVLRMLNDSGRVWTVKVDAATGTVT
jgi:hypothetical protein